MTAPAATSPEQTVSELMRLFDGQDFAAAEAMFAAEPQGIDEISRRWLRGRDALRDYFGQLKAAGISDVHSTLSDVHSQEWGDAALVTLMLDQTYSMGGESQSVHAPTTVVLRREDGSWKVALVHSVPLPDSD